MCVCVWGRQVTVVSVARGDNADLWGSKIFHRRSVSGASARWSTDDADPTTPLLGTIKDAAGSWLLPWTWSWRWGSHTPRHKRAGARRHRRSGTHNGPVWAHFEAPAPSPSPPPSAHHYHGGVGASARLPVQPEEDDGAYGGGGGQLVEANATLELEPMENWPGAGGTQRAAAHRRKHALHIRFVSLGLRLKSCGKVILEDVSAALAPGRMTAIMGPSGAGALFVTPAWVDRCCGELISGKWGKFRGLIHPLQPWMVHCERSVAVSSSHYDGLFNSVLLYLGDLMERKQFVKPKRKY